MKLLEFILYTKLGTFLGIVIPAAFVEALLAYYTFLHFTAMFAGSLVVAVIIVSVKKGKLM